LQQWLEHAQQAHPDWPQGDATSAWEHYESLGWMKRKTPIQRWRSCLETCFRNWASRNAPAQTESMDDFVERMNRPIIPGYRT
jgi:4-alpha-glucanotransferase